jgi:Ca2+-binding RTX toxin-like protein
LFAIGGGSITAIAGAGAETITGAVSPAGFGSTSSTGNNLFIAGSGNDSLQAGGGADTLQGGTGSAILSSGLGADTFSFVNGSAGGSDTITGFKAADTLQLTGYGLNSTTALNTAVHSGANTVLTLGDGTTITLSGVSLTPAGTLPIGKITAT